MQREDTSPKARPLSEIADEMEALTDHDPESSHGRADDLLLEALERLAPYATETPDEAVVDRITVAYARLMKWYA